ncbi:MAG: TolC family protein [Planctomycetota bacterium]
MGGHLYGHGQHRFREDDGRRRWMVVALGATVAWLMVAVGCSRTWFRRQADREVDCVLTEKGGYLDGGSVYPNADSRLFDPFAADRPPLPPDDPASHALMYHIDGKRGYKHWDKNGRTPTIESDVWLETLPRNDDGTVSLTLQDAVRVSRIHSREYQTNLETLYLSALDVTFERFRFDHQFFAGNRFSQSYRGRDVGRQSRTTLDSFAGFDKLTATGADIAVGFANSLIWDSWGTDSDLFTSVIDFSLVQPLLRFGGRARVLENLTQSERNLLANVRQMEQFRQGFYVNVTTGRTSGSGPSLGNQIGQAGLGLIAGLPAGRNGAPSPSGYLGLLQDQQEIRNQSTNIVALRDSLSQLEAAFEANRINSRLQVDQARQALLNAQSGLLTAKAAYESKVDRFKVDLGLPPALPVEIRDPLLDRFVLIDPVLTEMQDELAEALLEIRRDRESPDPAALKRSLDRIGMLDDGVDQQVSQAITKFDELLSRLPERRGQLRRIAQQVSDLDADVDPLVYDEERLMARVGFLQRRLPIIDADLTKTREARRALSERLDQDEPQDTWKQLNRLATAMSDLLLELSLIQAEIRLQGIGLLPISIDPRDALELARANRLDWMNARANLVDRWRKIEVFANDLRSTLDVTLDGQLATKPDNVLDFRKDRSRIRFGVEFDTPLARLDERNRYRAALIDYQQARRNYMLFGDRVSQSLRNTLRIIQLSQINLEVRRAAVQVAIAQVDIARLRLNPPVEPGKVSRTSPTAARDLVSALSDLLDAQNDFLSVWVSYETLRLLLDFEMGTMQLDPTGIWIDPGAIGENDNELQVVPPESMELIPPSADAEAVLPEPALDLPVADPEGELLGFPELLRPGLIEQDASIKPFL